MLSDFDFSVMSKASSLLFTESSNTRLGSIRWVAPEMLVEETPKRTNESDVYALGMTMLASNQPELICFTFDVTYAGNIHRRGTIPAVPNGL
ncbi:unnamed protein product [Rhizoctonia solani]|uniref:Protein kinase domain-containing protein n=1 Tax=Rhizoctonia solani TaxID=456999 RepID=A0A8H3HIK0_9AGAM|nr:unnamed protein product [Rhizoctonia solani]